MRLTRWAQPPMPAASTQVDPRKPKSWTFSLRPSWKKEANFYHIWEILTQENQKCCESYSRFFCIVKFPDKSEFQNLGKTIKKKGSDDSKEVPRKWKPRRRDRRLTAKTSCRFESLRGLKGSPGCRRSASWSPRSGSSSQTNLCTPWSGTWKMK